MIEQFRVQDWTMSDLGRRYLNGFFNDMNKGHKDKAQRDPKVLSAIAAKSLFEAEPIYVSAEACELVDHARETFEPEPVLPGDPFVPCGFALLATPMALLDAPWTPEAPYRARDGEHAGHLLIRAISWMPIHNDDMSAGTFWISYYTSAWDEDVDRYNGDEEFLEAMRRSSPMTLAHMFQWTWGENPWTDPEKLEVLEEEDPIVTAARGRAQAALAQTMWRIGSQFVPARERAPRGLWRDAQRRGFDQRDINVIRLRRTREAHEYEPSGREISVRFLVSGHWRNQPYPTLGEGVTRQIWIAPYVKGDESLPFKQTTRAWEFTR